MKSYLLSIIGFTLLFINVIYAKNGKKLSNDDKKINNNGDKYYLIYVNNTHGEYKIFNNNNAKFQKVEESQIFVDSLVDEINNLIIGNKNTYQNQEKLNEIEEEFHLRKRKRSTEEDPLYAYDEREFVYPISSVDDKVVLYAYLSKSLIENIKEMPNVYDCQPDAVSFTFNSYYNEKDILAQTKWKKLSVRKNADFHLSLLSQGKFNKNFVNKYDYNYYYPASAGKDIDIVLLDSSFNFDYSEFSNRSSRNVKCVAEIKNGKTVVSKSENSCGNQSITHGKYVSDLAGGLKHGVASLANIYGVGLANSNNQIKDSDILSGIQYIYEKLVRPNKTVINLSLGGFYDENHSFYINLESLINKINQKGGIVVAAAGNASLYLGKSKLSNIPCEFENVICVGGLDSVDIYSIVEGYEMARYSNHGPAVDIFAPSEVYVDIYNDGKVLEDKYGWGTSFASPLVVGIIATTMGENPNVKYTKKTILEKFKKESEKLTYFNGSGILANNGKRIVYSEDSKYKGCGIYAGNRPCPSGKSPSTTKDKVYPTIISKDGYCGPYNNFSICGNNQCCNDNRECGVGKDFCEDGCINGYGRCNDDKDAKETKNGDSNQGRCGPGFGSCIGYNECCSQYGYCGVSDEYCGNGCQRLYGKCLTPSSTTSKVIPTSTDPDRCGPGYGKCSGPSECCSPYGYCGTTPEHCGNGCLSQYGRCEPPTATTTKKIPTSTVSGRCGPNFGKCSKSNECCSKHNYCGTTTEYCGTGCQSEFGICSSSSSKPTTTKTSSTIPTSTDPNRCGPNYGRCSSSRECCSKHNYCGTSVDHCGKGCQIKYGICN